VGDPRPIAPGAEVLSRSSVDPISRHNGKDSKTSRESVAWEHRCGLLWQRAAYKEVRRSTALGSVGTWSGDVRNQICPGCLRAYACGRHRSRWLRDALLRVRCGISNRRMDRNSIVARLPTCVGTSSYDCLARPALDVPLLLLVRRAMDGSTAVILRCVGVAHDANKNMGSSCEVIDTEGFAPSQQLPSGSRHSWPLLTIEPTACSAAPYGSGGSRFKSWRVCHTQGPVPTEVGAGPLALGLVGRVTGLRRRASVGSSLRRVAGFRRASGGRGGVPIRGDR
jgi:hypothetical protein